MRLDSPTFSRAFRNLLRAERRRNPALRRAMRRARRPLRRLPWIGLLGRALFGLCPAAACLSHGSRGPALIGPVIASWWSLEVIILGRNIVQTSAMNWPPPLLFLPFARPDFLRMSRRNVQALAWRPFCDALWMMGALAIVHGAGIAGWSIILPLAAVGALATWTAAMWLTRWKISGWVTFGAMALPVVLFLLAKSDAFRPWLARLANRHGVELALLSPGGWTTAAFLSGLGELPASWWLAMIPLVLLAASAPFALANLLQRLAPEEKLAATWLHTARQGVEEPETPGNREADAPAASPSPSAVDFIRWWRSSREDFADCGWMERIFLRWLSPRERLVLACSASRLPRWTRWTKRSLVFLAVAALFLHLMWHSDSWTEMPFGIIGGLSGIIGLCCGLPIASGFDQMVGRVHVYGVLIARPAILPVQLREFLALRCKAAAVRCACMLPILTAAGALLVWLLGGRPQWGALWGAKLVILCMAGVPFLYVLAVSSASNDSQRGGLRGVVTGGLILLTSLLVLGLFVASFAAPPAWATAAMALFAVSSWGSARLYIRRFNRGRFDLVQTVRPT